MAAISGRVGQYVIGNKLGAGGMATVYRAYDPKRRRQVALKVLHAHWAAEPELINRFQREAQIASRLKHRGIVRVYDFGESDGHYYLAMQYMPGDSLAKFFVQPSHLRLSASARLLKQIAAPLDYAHKRGIVHRDLKLENVLLDRDSRPALSDFGLARVTDWTRLTLSGQITGTPLYMSPEQARGETDLDFRSDLYSLTVMAYLLATGYHPFSGASPYVILNQHIQRPPPLPTQVNPALPRALNPVLLKGLAKRPADRFESASAFAQAFAQAISGHNSTQTLILIAHPTPKAPEGKEDKLENAFTAVPLKARRFTRPRAAVILVSLLALLALLVFQLAAGPSPGESFRLRLTQQPVAVVTYSEGAFIRTGPGTNFETIASLGRGTLLSVLGQDEDGLWLNVLLEDGRIGWVYAPLVRVENPPTIGDDATATPDGD